jgi:hypothetical protein
VPDDTKTCFLRYFLYLGCKALDQKLTIYSKIPKRRCEGKRGKGVKYCWKNRLCKTQTSYV